MYKCESRSVFLFSLKPLNIHILYEVLYEDDFRPWKGHRIAILRENLNFHRAAIHEQLDLMFQLSLVVTSVNHIYLKCVHTYAKVAIRYTTFFKLIVMKCLYHS